MFSNLRTLALTFSLIASFFAMPRAHAVTPQADNTEQIMAVYSKFKTFGDFAKWLQAYDLATTEELHGVQKIFKKMASVLKLKLPRAFSLRSA